MALCLLGSFSVLLVPISAGAESVETLRARAIAIEAEINGLREEAIVAAEEFNQASVALVEAKAAVVEAEAALISINQELELRRHELGEYAIRSYVDGGEGVEVTGALSGQPTEVGTRLSYLKAASGSRADLIDRLNGAQAEAEVQEDAIEARRADAEGEQARVDAARNEIADKLDAQQQLLDGANEELLAAIVAEEQRRIAEEAEVARRAAEAAAAERRAAEAARAPLAVASTPVQSSSASGPEEEAEGDAAPEPEAAPDTNYPGVRAEAQRAIATALAQRGIPYVYGGASPGQGFDCSGLLLYSWASAGVRLPRTAAAQRSATVRITVDQLQPGDLVFYGEPPSHNAMYIGNDQIINAPFTGEVVRVQSLYYSRKAMTFGRII